jgi:hypothetical protein
MRDDVRSQMSEIEDMPLDQIRREIREIRAQRGLRYLKPTNRVKSMNALLRLRVGELQEDEGWS